MTAAEIQAKIEALTAESQTLGAQIDQIRDRRREIKDETHTLLRTLRLLDRAGGAVPVDATAEGATVEVTAEEMLEGMLAAVRKGKQH
jgi:prefoldin subunit 5